MKNSSWRGVLATVVGGCLAALSSSAASAETLSIQGSAGFANEVMAPYQDRIEALSGHKLKLTVNTAGQGLLAVLKGEADLAMISAPLDSMIAVLRKSRPDLAFQLLHEFRVAEARVALPVNPDNPVRLVSLEKLKQVLTGQIDNWRMLDGPDLPIHVVSLRDGGGAKRTTEDTLLGGQHMTPRSPILVESTQEVVTVARDPAALGICELVNLHRLPELQTKVSIVQSYNLVSLNEPTDAMRAVIGATRRIVFDEEP